jgi:PTH2 family peptidyl-tRNA hydrolase
MSETKQVIVMRKDLNMRKGKIAAQAAHASMKVLLEQMTTMYNQDCQRYGPGKTMSLVMLENTAIYDWLSGRFKKICVYVNSEQELLDIYQKTKDNNVISALVTDSGLTEFNNVPTNTCIAVGPDYSEVIDKVTGHLPLF